MPFSKDLLKISPNVYRALKEHRPVVSLESTIISHGMPYPNNKKCALEVEQILRDKGVEPATIAIMNKKICIGLNEDEIQELAKRGGEARKVSRRDIPLVLAQGGLGSTTVAGTMICSALAGIEIFVTGGLGGVHRGFEETMDVSADLRELGRTPVTVVSAGVKNILDIPRTLEYLQTEGVPVVTYGSKHFPAFFAPSSGIQSPIVLNSIEDIAEMLFMRKKLNLQNGILVAVPNQDTENGEKIEQAIKQALKEAEEQHIRGAATTPFLLKRVHQLTEGASIKTNISLVKNNAEIGASLALEYNKKTTHSKKNTYFTFEGSPQQQHPHHEGKGKLIAVGASALDYEITVQGKLQLYNSCRGKWRTTLGGVARNISETAARLGSKTVLVTALSNDGPSKQIRKNIQSFGIQLHQIRCQTEKAPTFLNILDDTKDSMIQISDMEINTNITLDNIKSSFFKEEEKKVDHNDIVVLDANIKAAGNNLLDILAYLNSMGYFIIYECKGTKTDRAVFGKAYEYISCLKMNEKELEFFLKTLKEQGQNIPSGQEYEWIAKNVGSKTKNYNYGTMNAIITRGGEGVITVVFKEGNTKSLTVTKSTKVKKTTGAGDTLTGAICSFLLRGEDIGVALSYAVIASRMTVQSAGVNSVICDDLSSQTLEKEFKKSRVHQLL